MHILAAGKQEKRQRILMKKKIENGVCSTFLLTYFFTCLYRVRLKSSGNGNQ